MNKEVSRTIWQMYEGDRLSSVVIAINGNCLSPGTYMQVGLGGLTSITHSFNLRHPMKNSYIFLSLVIPMGSVLNSTHLLMYYSSFILMFLETLQTYIH